MVLALVAPRLQRASTPRSDRKGYGRGRPGSKGRPGGKRQPSKRRKRFPRQTPSRFRNFQAPEPAAKDITYETFGLLRQPVLLAGAIALGLLREWVTRNVRQPRTAPDSPIIPVGRNIPIPPPGRIIEYAQYTGYQIAPWLPEKVEFNEPQRVIRIIGEVVGIRLRQSYADGALGENDTTDTSLGYRNGNEYEVQVLGNEMYVYQVLALTSEKSPSNALPQRKDYEFSTYTFSFGGYDNEPIAWPRDLLGLDAAPLPAPEQAPPRPRLFPVPKTLPSPQVVPDMPDLPIVEPQTLDRILRKVTTVVTRTAPPLRAPAEQVAALVDAVQQLEPWAEIPWPGGPKIGSPAKRPPATLEGIARELGKIEEKASAIGGGSGGGGPDLEELLDRIADLLTDPPSYSFPAGGYQLAPICDRDADGNLLDPLESNWPAGTGELAELRHKVDALAELMQFAKIWKQPVCPPERSAPMGAPVTVTFEEVPQED